MTANQKPNLATPKVVVVDGQEAASRFVADEIAAMLHRRPQAVLGLATGGTPVGVYQELVRRQAVGTIDLRQVTTFNLDEYVGLPPEHPQSFFHFMKQNLFDATRIPAERTHVPPGQSHDFDSAALVYENEIVNHGGIDWQLLGIGENGHIAFNEPGSPGDSRTRVIELTEETIAANSRFFDDPADVPRKAITMGIGTILQARRIVLMALGANKADAIASALQGPADTDCPASFLQTHPDVTFVLDEAAAARL